MGSIVILLLFIIFLTTKAYERAKLKQHQLPALGFSTIWGSYLASVVDVFRANRAVKRASRKYGDRLFTFAQLGEWCVMVKSKEHVKDHYNAQEDVLSMEAAAEELLQLRHTVGDQFCDETYHIPAIRTSMNLNLEGKLPELLEEMVCSFHDEIDALFEDNCGDWKPLKASRKFGRVLARISNRLFVGLPLCRNSDYCDLVCGFSNSVIVGGAIIRMLIPRFLRPLSGRVFRRIFRHHERMFKHLAPIIEEHKRQSTNDVVIEPPNDMVTWLMATSPGEDYTAESLSMRILNVNFVALHTTTKAFTHALYYLASKPSYISVLRSEVATHLSPTDPTTWTQASLARCVKLDSFIKESLRLNGLGAMWMPRLTLGDFTFSDGTVVPRGNFVATAVTAIHEDERNYEAAREFDGLRFARMASKGTEVPDPKSDTEDTKIADMEQEVEPGNETESDSHWKHRLTGTSPTYLTFGGGRHICPGRFLASLEMKSLMAYLLLHYDVKMPRDGVRPPDEWIGPTSSPASNANVLFRRRHTSEGLVD